MLVLVQGVCEITGVVALSFILVKAQLCWRRVLRVAITLFVVIQVARYLPFFFGFHTLLGILLLTIYLSKSLKVPLPSSFMASFVSTFTLAVIEFIFNAFTFGLLKVKAEEVAADRLLWTLIGFPQAVALIALAWAAAYFRSTKGQAKRNDLPPIQ